MSLKNLIIAAAFAFSGLTTSVVAAPIHFTPDIGGSDVVVDDGGVGCSWFSNCGLSASIASGFGGEFDLEVGDTNVFDFITFDANGTGSGHYTVDAVLAFSDPALVVNSSGSGTVTSVFGSIILGTLSWGSYADTLVNVDGNIFNVHLDGGVGLFLGSEVTTTASVTLVSVSAVPLPAAGLMLLGAVGGFGMVRRRK